MTSTINSHAFLAKKPMTSPAVLKTKLAIAQTNPGKISPSFFPMVFNPLPTPLPRDVNPFFKYKQRIVCLQVPKDMDPERTSRHFALF